MPNRKEELQPEEFITADAIEAQPEGDITKEDIFNTISTLKGVALVGHVPIDIMDALARVVIHLEQTQTDFPSTPDVSAEKPKRSDSSVLTEGRQTEYSSRGYRLVYVAKEDVEPIPGKDTSYKSKFDSSSSFRYSSEIDMGDGPGVTVVPILNITLSFKGALHRRFKANVLEVNKYTTNILQRWKLETEKDTDAGYYRSYVGVQNKEGETKYLRIQTPINGDGSSYTVTPMRLKQSQPQLSGPRR